MASYTLMSRASGARRPLGRRREDGSPLGPSHAGAWYMTAVPEGARQELSASDSTLRVAFICSDRGLISNAQSKVVLLLPSVQLHLMTPSEFSDKVARQGDLAQQAPEEPPKALQ